MTSVLGRGLAAGAVGTTAVTALTRLDAAWRGRAPGSAPQEVVAAAARALGRDVPGTARQRADRLAALGTLAGIATGLGVGVAAAAARATGVRAPAPLGAVLTGAAAMAAADLPAGLLGVSDPRARTAGDWVSDAAPHLAYGAAVQAVLRALEPAGDARRRAPAALVVRAAALGAAAGSRSTLGVAGPVLTARGSGRAARAAALLATAGELAADKLPAAPSRTAPPSAVVRFSSAATGAAVLAGRERVSAVVPVVAAAAGAAAGTWGGRAARGWASQRLGTWQSGLAEDAVVLALAAWACRPRRAGRAPGPAAPPYAVGPSSRALRRTM